VIYKLLSSKLNEWKMEIDHQRDDHSSDITISEIHLIYSKR